MAWAALADLDAGPAGTETWRRMVVLRRVAYLRVIGDGEVMASLADPGIQAAYVSAARAVLRAVAPAGEDQRRDSLLQALTTALDGVAPPVGGMELRDGGGAEFTPSTWTITLGRNGLAVGASAVQQAVLAGVLYHEARHAEQAFRSACRLARDHKQEPEDKLTLMVLAKMKLPLAVAAAAASKATVAVPGDADTQDAKWLASYLNKTNDELQYQAARASGFFFDAERFETTAISDLIALAGPVRTSFQAAITREVTSLQALVTEAPQDFTTARQAWEEKKSAYGKAVVDAHNSISTGFALIKAYRNIPEEADAHSLGWQIETAYLDGVNPQNRYEAARTAGTDLFAKTDRLQDALLEALAPEDFELVHFDEQIQPRGDALDTYVTALDTATLANWQTVLHDYHAAIHSLAFSRDNI